jgi:hypothetical protein
VSERVLGDVTDAWRERVTQWLQFARTPGHDVAFHQLNLPWFAELLPSAGQPADARSTSAVVRGGWGGI